RPAPDWRGWERGACGEARARPISGGGGPSIQPAGRKLGGPEARHPPELREKLVFFSSIALFLLLRAAPTRGLRTALGGAQANRSGPLGGPSAFRSTTRLCHANFRSCSPLSFDRRFRPALLHARRLRGRTGLSAL